MQVINLDRSTHETVQKLLPWFVTTGLQDDEHHLVEDHVRTCSQCQADVEWERRFRHSVSACRNTVIASSSVERALTRLQPQLEDRCFDAKVRRYIRVARENWRSGSSGMRIVVAVQFVLIAGLAYRMLSPQPDAAYMALTQAHLTGANVIVAFKPSVSEIQMRRILASNSARLVNGPTMSGAYLLAVPDNQRAETLARLQADSAVAMAAELDVSKQQ